jgi:hypothetical protein
MKIGKTPIPILAILMLLLACMNLQATTYEVGLTKPLTAIGQVSWESLQAGDTVLITGGRLRTKKSGSLVGREHRQQ